MADRIKNQLIATHITLHINFHKSTRSQPRFSSINHHNTDVFSVIICSAVTVFIILTSTVDILTAKQITAGENIIQIRFSIVRYFNTLLFLHNLFNILSLPTLKTDNKIIAGDKIIAIQIIPILITNTNNIAINGIPTANVWQKDNILLSNDT